MNNLELINSIIERHIKKNVVHIQPQKVQLTIMNAVITEDFIILSKVNFYFGLAKSKNATIIDRHKKHRAKLDVDLKGYTVLLQKNSQQ